MVLGLNIGSEIADLLDRTELRRVVTSCPLALSTRRLDGSRHDFLRAPLKPVTRFLNGFIRIPDNNHRPRTGFVFFLAKTAREVGRHQASHDTKRASSAEGGLILGSNFDASGDNVRIAIPEKISLCEGPHVSHSW